MEIKVDHETNKNGSKSTGKGGVQKSEFLTNLAKIPLICTTISLASDLYERAKLSSRLVNSGLSLAETSLHFAKDVTSPIVNRLTPIAAAPLATVDGLASKGLLSLERNVPVIKKQPQEIYSETKGMLETKLHPTVERLNGVTNSVLSSRVAQLYFNIYEKMLFTVGHILNSIIPPSQNPETSRFPHDSPPQEKSSRGTWLMKESYYLCSSVASRIFGLAQSRLDSAVNAAQNMKKTL